MLYKTDCGCIVLAESRESKKFRVFSYCGGDREGPFIHSGPETSSAGRQFIVEALPIDEEIAMWEQLFQLQADGYRYRDLRAALKL